MSAFRRRLMAMQKKDSIDWDYEWSYLSGELPSDERFIKSNTGNVYLTEEGLKFDGINAILQLQNHNRIALYIKANIQYKTENASRGFMITLHGDTSSDDTNKEFEVIFDGVNREVKQNAGPVKKFGEYNFGEDCTLLIYIDFHDEWEVMQNTYIIYNGGEKQSAQNFKWMWYEHSSKIYTDNGRYNSEGYVLVKELKFKTFDS